jgi:hypothetical protein
MKHILTGLQGLMALTILFWICEGIGFFVLKQKGYGECFGAGFLALGMFGVFVLLCYFTGIVISGLLEKRR